MATQRGALRDALLDAGVSVDKAARAAEEGAIYEMLLAGMETRLSVLTWMACVRLGLTVLAIGGLVTLASKLGEMSGQIARGID